MIYDEDEDDEDGVDYLIDCKIRLSDVRNMIDIILNQPERIKLEPPFQRMIEKRRLCEMLQE